MADNDFRSRRVRSTSVSLEPSQEKAKPFGPTLDAAIVGERNHCNSTPSPKSQTLNAKSSVSSLSTKETKSLGSKFNNLINFVKSKCFPYFKFQSLPDEVKIHVFKYFGQKNLCQMMLVCKEWNSLIRTPLLWTRVDFSIIQLCSHPAKRDCLLTCYPAYKSRVNLYAELINNIKPPIRFLKFAFDIGDYEDRWKDILMALVTTGRLRDLQWAELNWKETKEKRMITHNNNSATWSDSELRNFSINRRFRQRIFLQFFDVFTAITPNLQHLQLPFDWFDTNIQAFSRLENLKSLRLDLYFAYFHVTQEKLSQLLSLLPSLRKLTLEFWEESDLGFQQYTIQHQNLTFLDISMCKGVYIHHVDLPKLKQLRILRAPKKWVFASDDSSHDTLPCLHRVLSDGAPGLHKINHYELEERWVEDGSEGLEKELRKICPCTQHCSQ